MEIPETFRSYGPNNKIDIIDLPYSKSLNQFKKVFYESIFESGLALGTNPDAVRRLFHTVNIRPSAMIEVKSGKKKAKVPWCKLTSTEQRNYFKHYIRHVISPFVLNYIAVFEYTKIGELHMHLLCTTSHSLNDYRKLIDRQALT